MERDFDILIVGAGLSGIGLACHLKKNCPDKSFAILEARESLGGTWDLFRYPGIRSDSDMSTMSYGFKPWNGEKDIASGQSILDYLKQTATQFDVDQHIQYGLRVNKASWSSEQARWTLHVDSVSGETRTYSCNMLLTCTGYYSYESGHRPDFDDQNAFAGVVVHPQHWPEDLDYEDKQVLVIGSGATAVTLVPAIAEKAKHTVMLQRSPSYMLPRPDVNTLSKFARACLPAQLAHSLLRWWNSRLAHYLYQRSRTHPEGVKRYLLRGVQAELGENYDLDPDFVPNYDPWDQRLCLVPNGDFFKAIKNGSASVVTDHIERFTRDGVLLKSGRELRADVIVTATGLEMLVQGGIKIEVDDVPVDLAKTFTYMGMMNSGVPNLITTFGYVNASWTLRSDLIAGFICRILKRMDRQKVTRVTPRPTTDEQTMQQRPFIEGFSSNYIKRALHLLPKQGDQEPWVNPQNYEAEKTMIGRAKFDDGRLVFE